MRRFCVLVLGFSLLAAGAGCSMCETPYDCTGPVVDAPYGTPRGGGRYAPSEAVAPDEPYYTQQTLPPEPTPREVAQRANKSGMQSVVRQPTATASRAMPESRSARPAE